MYWAAVASNCTANTNSEMSHTRRLSWQPAELLIWDQIPICQRPKRMGHFALGAFHSIWRLAGRMAAFTQSVRSAGILANA